MNEFSIIKKYFLPLTKESKESGKLLDDVAKISFKANKQLAISKDLMAEDIHFSKKDGAFNIAKKLLKSNLSDLAASGAKPLYYMLGFSQENLNEDFIEEFCQGLKEVSDEFGLVLIGGDSIRIKGKLCFSLTIFGELPKNKSLERKNAKSGDLIFVSGNIGDAFLGLNLLQKKITCSNKNFEKYLINQHLNPNPQIKLGMKLLQNNLSTTAIDISDGFLADLLHICQASNLDCQIDLPKIPFSIAAQFFLKQKLNITYKNLLSGGEDYQLIFTSKPANQAKITKLAKELKLKITCVGKMIKTKEVPEINLLDSNKQKIAIEKYGYLHY